MSGSIIETLQSAEDNLRKARSVGNWVLPLVQTQLRNAVGLLEKGYNIHDLVDLPLMRYGTVEQVPDKEKA